MVAKGDRYGPDSLSISGEGKHVAFVGPLEFTVTVVDARSLDEVCTTYTLRVHYAHAAANKS